MIKVVLIQLFISINILINNHQYYQLILIHHFLFGNSIIKSNKADILNIFDQQLIDGDNTNIYVNKHGVIIDDNGPFWPENYRILHATPKLLSRELTPKEFYLSSSMSSKKRKKS